MSKKTGGKFGSLSALLAWCLPSSLTGKQIALTVFLFAGFIWALVFISAKALGNQIEQVLFHEQFTSARHIASEIDTALTERMDNLAYAARQLPARFSPRILDQHLSQLYVLHHLFAGGIEVIGLDGETIARYPAVPGGRSGNQFGDREYFHQVLVTRQPYIDKPTVGSVLKRPTLVIGVPVFDGNGEIRAVMIGITDLTAANFLGHIADPALPGASEITIASIRSKIIIASTVQRLAMAPTPERGVNVMYDRFADGFQGSGIALDENGTRKLYSGVGVPATDWIVMVALPAEAVFQPIAAMQRNIYFIAELLTLLAVILIGWMTRRTLAPLENARHALQRMTGGQAPLGPLPVERNDEVGQLIGSFNMLVEDRQRHETALARSEQRFRLLVESAPDAIFVESQERFAYVNAAAIKLFRAANKDELLGQLVLDRIHPDDHGKASEWLDLLSTGRSIPPIEGRLIPIVGSPVHVEVSAVRFRYEEADGTLVFVRNITERKRAEQAVRNSEAKLARSRQKLRELSAHNEHLLEQERRNIAREIHDELGQLLTALKMDCSLLRRAYPEDPYFQKKIEDMRSMLDNTIGVARHVVSNLRPPALDHGIIPAIEWLAEDFSLRWEIECSLKLLEANDIVLDDGRATALFRIIQESLTNVARHAQASRVIISLERVDTQLQLCIEDNGKGFDPKVVAKERGFGLQGMRERTIAQGGILHISSIPGQGTSVIVAIPL